MLETLPEQLFECPQCHRKNFTARGLKAHNCARSQAEPEKYNQPPESSAQRADATAPDGENAVSLCPSVEHSPSYWTEEKPESNASLCPSVAQRETEWSVLDGFPKAEELDSLIRRLVADLCNLSLRVISLGVLLHFRKGGMTWREFSAKCKRDYGISRGTASNYMRLAARFRERMHLQAAQVAALPFAGENDEPTQLALKFVGGRTLGELYADEGITGQATPTPRGGYHPRKADAPPPRIEFTAEAAALDIWAPVIATLEIEGLEKKSWVDLNDAARAQLRGVLVDLLKEMRA
jgi:hypothetical protein